MSKYYNIKKSFQDLKESKQLSKTVLAVASIVVKGLANTVLFVLTVLIPSIFHSIASKNKKTLKNNNLTPEQRVKIEENLNKYEELKPNIDKLENYRKD